MRYRLFHPGRLPLAEVAAAHVLALALLYVYFHLHHSSLQRRATVRVRLISPPAPGPAASATAASTHPPSPPKPVPAARPRASKKTAAKPAVKPNPKPVPKPKRQHYRSAAEIRRSASLEPQPRRASSHAPGAHQATAAEIQARLAGSLRGTASVSTTTGGEVSADYYDALLAHLHQVWRQPSRSQVPNRDLAVTIRLQLHRDGRVTASRLLSPSGNVAMDASVRQLLAALNRVPPFPDNIAAASLSVAVDLRLTH